MRQLLLVIVLFKISVSFAQNKPAVTLRAVLIEQLKTTHNKKEWFVPVNTAVEGLTAEQAMWKDSSGNHSAGQLVYHLVFWNGRELAKFRGEKPEAYNGDNNETFNNKLDKDSWAALVKKLDDVLTQLEKVISEADDAKLQSWSADIANVSTHNAYHTGQIIFVRKLQGSWDPEKGVK
ncbi:MAG TPA: DinB family protein [Chitinophagaceae bacterium]|jgi:DinB superfamily|nr:DinB family protein [Chitinophagaceae bacterium]